MCSSKDGKHQASYLCKFGIKPYFRDCSGSYHYTLSCNSDFQVFPGPLTSNVNYIPPEIHAHFAYYEKGMVCFPIQIVFISLTLTCITHISSTKKNKVYETRHQFRSRLLIHYCKNKTSHKDCFTYDNSR